MIHHTPPQKILTLRPVWLRERCEDLAYVFLSEMTKMCYDVNELEVTRAKNQLKASLLFNQDSTHRESCPH